MKKILTTLLLLGLFNLNVFSATPVIFDRPVNISNTLTVTEILATNITVEGTGTIGTGVFKRVLLNGVDIGTGGGGLGVVTNVSFQIGITNSYFTNFEYQITTSNNPFIVQKAWLSLATTNFPVDKYINFYLFDGTNDLNAVITNMPPYEYWRGEYTSKRITSVSITNNIAIGDYIVKVNDATPFSVGDPIVLVLTNTPTSFELNRIFSINATHLTLESPVQHEIIKTNAVVASALPIGNIIMNDRHSEGKIRGVVRCLDGLSTTNTFNFNVLIVK
jgi:hypothetical protein